MKINRKYYGRFLIPILIGLIGQLMGMLIKGDSDSVLYLRAFGVSLLIGSILFIALVFVFQFFIKNNNYLLPICLMIATSFIYAQFKIMHWPMKNLVLVVGNGLSVLLLALGLWLNQNGKSL